MILPYKHQEGVWWNAGIPPLIRDFRTRICGYFHILSALLWRKSPRYSLNKRLDGGRKNSECFGRDKNVFPHSGIERFLDHPVSNLDTIPNQPLRPKVVNPR